jgi:DNA-binding NtrC family response regulator
MVRTSGQEKVLSDNALKAMLAYDWPGNVRELENCLERSYAFTSGPLVHTTDLPREVANLPLPDSSNGDGHGNGHGKIIPMAELERQTILSAITRTQRRQAPGARLAGHWKDHALPQAQGLRGSRVSIRSPILNLFQQR